MGIFKKIKLIIVCLPIFVLAQEESVVIPKIHSGAPLPANLFIQIGKKLNPSVVNISTTMKRADFHGVDDIFELFLFPNAPSQRQARPQPSSLGSGFVIESTGYVVTNAHVIDKADTIYIQFKNDPVKYTAQVVGADKATDVALIKIDTQKSKRKAFPIVELGDSNALQVGEWVAAFGNPFGHSNTMTKGIISAINRHIDELNLLPFLQTDASINPGNSGGPLVNTQGQVIGVNTAINPRAQNIGFAIPIFNVKAILKSLKKYGYVKRGFIGVQMDTSTVEFSHQEKTFKGVLIVDVVKDGPADQGGVQAQDIITEFNGTPIESSKDLFKIVSATPVNEKVKGSLFRNQRMVDFHLTVKERPRSEAPASQSDRKKQGALSAPHNLGFKIAQASTQLPPQLNLPLTYANRPIVVEVQQASPAHRAKLQQGDIVFSVNGNNVQTVEDVFKRLNSSRRNILHVLRFDQPGRYNLKKVTIIK